ncbi:MAG: hypothetical protein ACXIVQ_03960 [Acidimicrobiales bacterium]
MTILATGDRLQLQIYLNDHRAGAAGGLALGRRLAANNDGTDLGATVTEIVSEIEDEAPTLDRLISRFGLLPNPAKRTLVLVAERAGRFKTNGQLRGYAPLSRLLEIEGLMAGIHAKRSLWVGLRAAIGTGSIDDIDLDRLIAQADSQRERLLPHHEAAAVAALSASRAGD